MVPSLRRDLLLVDGKMFYYPLATINHPPLTLHHLIHKPGAVFNPEWALAIVDDMHLAF